MEIESSYRDEVETQHLDYVKLVEESGMDTEGMQLQMADCVYKDDWKGWEDWHNVDTYTVEVPRNMMTRYINLYPNELLAFFIMINLQKNAQCRLPSEKPKRTTLNKDQFNSCEIRVIEGVRLRSKLYKGTRKLLYHDYKFDETDFYKFPIFSWSEEVYPFNYDKVKAYREVEVRNLHNDFEYIGDNKFALIERGEYETKDQKIAERKELHGKLSSCRYKRTYSVFGSEF